MVVKGIVIVNNMGTSSRRVPATAPLTRPSTGSTSAENACELDLIFHSDRVHYILDEIVMAGMVLDTNINNVLKATRDMTKLHQKSLSKLNDLVQSSPSRLSPSQRAAGHQGGSPF
ncbi:hypothetical protein JL722_1861 [Aureococcus anophagefferens]|nr:hypothetical protein JL722_1861 [Aureococcus anophagefferens]